MERSKRDLESIITSQKEELIRYETRLKDVVTAYKGLLKEKEALESSLSAITKGKDTEKKNINISNVKDAKITAESANEDKSGLQTQIITLMNSLATLSAEKSRMEASFQADKKQMRQQLQQKDKKINEMQEKIKENDENLKQELENFKAKLIAEHQEREKETNDHMIMIRELQKLYADERHLKENIEMQLNNFKTEFASSLDSTQDVGGNRFKELTAQLKDARMRIKQLELINKYDGTQADSSNILKHVQSEMSQLKEQHAIAIKNEQNRAQLAEERSKKLAAVHEDRVANLEARLAELSATVGNYDRLRQQDQDSIHKLKKKIQNLVQNGNQQTTTVTRQESISQMNDISAIVDEIMRLKNRLIKENSRSTNPIDVGKIFSIGSDHVQCQQELNSVQLQLEAKNIEILGLEENVQLQKSHLATLQTKVKVLNRNIDEQDAEIKQQTEKLRQAVKEERAKWKGIMEEMENDFRSKINEMEQQLQKQRVRSLQLLDEKENEIKNLQTSFEVFATPHYHQQQQQQHQQQQNTSLSSTVTSASHTNLSDEIVFDGADTSTRRATKTTSRKSSVGGENCHMLHYANEIARKDIEIANLRKGKYAAESSLRKVLQDKVSAQEDLCDKIANLEDEVDRLERCQTREGANLEYLKNVIISFISTKDEDGKRHMVNAIGAVLQFSPTEVQAINNAFYKK